MILETSSTVFSLFSPLAITVLTSYILSNSNILFKFSKTNLFDDLVSQIFSFSSIDLTSSINLSVRFISSSSNLVLPLVSTKQVSPSFLTSLKSFIKNSEFKVHSPPLTVIPLIKKLSFSIFFTSSSTEYSLVLGEDICSHSFMHLSQEIHSSSSQITFPSLIDKAPTSQFSTHFPQDIHLFIVSGLWQYKHLKLHP